MENFSVQGELPVTNAQGVIVAKVTVSLGVIAVTSDAPPQYTGPNPINDLVVDVGRQLQGMDPDGDPFTWSVDPADADKVNVTAGGMLTAKKPLGAQGAPETVTVYMDDGKTEAKGKKGKG